MSTPKFKKGLKKDRRGPGELQAGQPHLSPWEGEENHHEQVAWIQQEEVMLDQTDKLVQ